MARKKTTLPEPDKAQIEAVLKAARTGHYMSGGDGCSCFIWINGRVAGSENSIRIDGLEAALRKVPNVRTVKINID
jgi:hypothetical protein